MQDPDPQHCSTRRDPLYGVDSVSSASDICVGETYKYIYGRPCLDLGDKAGDSCLLFLAGGEVLVPLHQRLQCEYICVYL